MGIARSKLKFLRNRIIIGELKPGQRLSENRLSRELGISRPPLREAFRILEEDGLLVHIPRKGAFVTELSLKDCEEICQTREMIECFAVDLFKAYDIMELPKALAALRLASTLTLPFDRTNPEAFINSIMTLVDLHYSMIESSGNSRLIDSYRSISYNLARYQYIYFQFNVGNVVQRSLSDHEEILRLISVGNYDQAREKLREHIKSAEELVKNKLFH